MKKHLLYSGKSKSVFATDNPDKIVILYRDDATAFNGVKKASLEHKGQINNYFNAFFMDYLKKNGIENHFEEVVSDTESICKKIEIIPVECIVRNRVAGSLSKRLGIPEGGIITEPLFEFFLKNDELGDPLINEEHIYFLNLASCAELEFMKKTTLKINELLTTLFAQAGLVLVDFKLEFGRFHNKIILGDEITPDGCRIWDAKTLEKLDKDRFRRDLGNVLDGYREIAHRLNIPLTSS